MDFLARSFAAISFLKVKFEEILKELFFLTGRTKCQFLS